MAAAQPTAISFLDAASWNGSMHEQLAWLRRHQPLFWSERDGLWIATKYADVEAVSKNQRLFTSADGVRPGNPTKLGLIDEGEPRHTELRKLIHRGFTPRMVAQLEGPFLEIVNEALSKVAPRGECDFVNDIAVPLPLLLIAEMMGIRREDRDRFHRWSDDMIAADGNEQHAGIMARAGAAFMEYSAYVTEIIEARRLEPRNDLVSILVGAKDRGELLEFDQRALPGQVSDEQHIQLANNELIMLLVVLLVAGNETTRNALSGGMQLLIENPGERQKLVDDPALIPSAVEEMVRLVSPVHSFARTATEDTLLRGCRIRRGQKILLVYPSANRDEEVFTEPDRFRVDRNPQHLGFGVGSHFCLGANLARMELRVAFRELLRRFPDMHYAADGPVLKPSALVRSCVEMRVRFTPEPAHT